MASIKNQAKKILDSLSDEDAKAVFRFLQFIEEKECREATREILDIPEMEESIGRGLKDLQEDHTVSWDKLRRRVSR
jgi:hypothetical protein